MPPYSIVLSITSLKKIVRYKKELQTNRSKPGNLLQNQINSLPEKGRSFQEITTEQFIQLLLLTKKIICFAESEIFGDGTDWNKVELQLLGDLNVAVDVEVYDNGVWSPCDRAFKMHNPPLQAVLLFTPGPLLYGDRFCGLTPDFEEICDRDQVNQEKYNKLIERRLLPLFVYANESAKTKNKRAVVVLPGIGCGAFAGKFLGKMGNHLKEALRAILKVYGTYLRNLACVRFDPYMECVDFEKTYYRTIFRVRKIIGPQGKPQLSSIEDFEEIKNEFENCYLYKIVAWDHVSLPGNDYFRRIRNTDDGVSAAATNSMQVFTGVTGKYLKGKYMPPEGNMSWESVALKYNTHLVADKNVEIALLNGTCVELNEFEISLSEENGK